MKIHRFIVESDLNEKMLRLTDRDLVNQIKNVLKLKKGEPLVLANGRLKEANATIVDIGWNTVDVEIHKTVMNQNEVKLQTVIFCSILKKDHFDTVVQKTTEVGVAEIYPVISNRTIKVGVNVERLQKIAREAAEQSGRGIVPIVHDPVTFKEALEYARPNDANWFFEPNAPLFDKGVLKMKGMNRIGLFIGTEGGWDEAEVELAKKNYFNVASLGPLVFRAETAAIIATYLISYTYL